MQKVLILGAGLVSKPAIIYLLERNYFVTIAAMDIEPVQFLKSQYSNVELIQWTTNQTQQLDTMVADHHITVSLLPFKFHPMVAEYCIKQKKPLVTTSYVKPEMQALDQAARQAGVILLNEIGLDPGIDHMSAMRIIDHIHGKGGEIEEFYSICGALPAPESAQNPFGYKFSWAPRGVILASKSDALYLKNGQQVFIPTQKLFEDRFSFDFPGVGLLEIYPNRNSVDYIDIYGVSKAKTIYRGTFRFPGWCEALHAMKILNLLDETPTNLKEKSFAQIVAEKIDSPTSSVKQNLAKYLGVSENSRAIEAFEWLGLFDQTPIQNENISLFDVIADKMLMKMSMTPDDRDMVVMLHSFVAKYPDGTREVIHSKMVDFGSAKTHTAVARTVSIPAAIAVEMILNGRITSKGVWRPVIPEIYNPVLDELEKHGIKMVEEFGLPLGKKLG